MWWSVIQLGQAIAGALLATGLWTVAQSTIGTELERYIGGGILVVVALAIVRWVTQASERIESLWTGAVNLATERAERAEDRIEELEHTVDELRRKLDNERVLRASFETELTRIKRQIT